MNSVPQRILKLPMERRAILALRSAVKKAIADRVREGLPVYVWYGGRVVDISARRPRVPQRAVPVKKTG